MSLRKSSLIYRRRTTSIRPNTTLSLASLRVSQECSLTSWSQVLTHPEQCSQWEIVVAKHITRKTRVGNLRDNRDLKVLIMRRRKEWYYLHMRYNFHFSIEASKNLRERLRSSQKGPMLWNLKLEVQAELIALKKQQWTITVVLSFEIDALFYLLFSLQII